MFLINPDTRGTVTVPCAVWIGLVRNKMCWLHKVQKLTYTLCSHMWWNAQLITQV